jgi:diguanylate cyclase (GGDEF)-like protein
MNDIPIKVLLVEDNLTDAQIVRAMLNDAGREKFSLIHIERLTVALRRLKAEHFDAVLLDISKTHSHGLDSITRIEAVAPDVAIVALSETADDALALDVVHAGAQDYLIKGQGDGFLIARSIRYAIEHKKEKGHLKLLAQYDPLTGLANRVLFRDLLDKALSRANRSKLPIGLMFLDLDRFKVINDTLGHDIGDLLLKVVAQRLKGCVRSGDFISRLGGDEFTVIQEGVSRKEDIEVVAQKILNTMVQPFALDGNELFIGTSIGIAIYPNHGRDAETLVKNADTAMYSAKERGRNNYRFYMPKMGEEAARRLELENDLRHALERDEFLLYYQPQFCLRTMNIIGVEALLRWRRQRQDEIVLPNEFITLAEETGLIVQVGEWALREACTVNKQWQDSGLMPLRISVNVSGRQFHHKDLAQTVRRVLAESGLKAEYLELELTEGLIMENLQVDSNALAVFRDMGVHISIDDFGTGYSSLSCLKRMPIDTLKIDGTLIHDVHLDSDNAAITTAIIALANNMRLNVVAEGIEKQEEVSYLVSQGCYSGQGKFFCKPLSAEEFVKFISQHKKLRAVANH